MRKTARYLSQFGLVKNISFYSLILTNGLYINQMLAEKQRGANYCAKE